jgi:hypothetical protein
VKVRKLPLVVEAHRWYKNGDHPDDGPADREGEVVRRFRHPNISADTSCGWCGRQMHDHGWIDTLEGGLIVCPGDWIITGAAGERYPVKPDIFATTYEPVSGHPQGALVEVIEKRHRKIGGVGGELIVPTEVRLNGQALLLPAENPITIHEMKLPANNAVLVTITMFARRVLVDAETEPVKG